MAGAHSLTNVVVDTDDTAALLMKRLEERHGGRVTFMPLNRLRVKNVTYPDHEAVRPLLQIAMTYPREVSELMDLLALSLVDHDTPCPSCHKLLSSGRMEHLI